MTENSISSLVFDQLATLPEIAKTLPTRPNASTLWRWCIQGAHGVHLEHVRIGRKILTSKEALARFAAASAEAASATLEARHAEKTPPLIPKRRRRPARRQREIEAAERVIFGGRKNEH